MGTDFAEAAETLPPPRAIKVHRLMCTELINLVNRVRAIFPEIEAARPRCSSGIQALCLLNSALEKSRSLLQHCSESSKLYLAITGDVILSRCKKSRNLLVQSLSQLQTMVPVMLAMEISRIIDDLGGMTLSLDPSEEEAGKVVKTLLQRYASAADSTEESATDSIEESAIECIQIAASRLQITSSKALLIEKRSIKKLLDKIGDGEQPKKQILIFLLNLLKKYGKSIVREQTENACHVQHEDSDQSVQMESCIEYGPEKAQTDMLRRPIPLEEFKCPISLKLMYDPVVIASGQTFERMWIQKWFDEGHDTCPKTKRKLPHLSLTPNTAMRDLISKWCMVNGATILDPRMQSAAVHSWETSSTSIASLSSSMNDLCLPVDFSNVSLGSLDNSHSLDSSRVKIADGTDFISVKSDDDYCRFQSSAIIHEMDKEFLYELDALPWESQCKVVEDVKNHLKHDDRACHVMSFENFVEPLTRFLNNAHDLPDVKAQRTGCLLLLAFVSKCSIPSLHDSAYELLVSFLDSEVTKEALAIIEVVSHHDHCRSKIATSGALTSIQKMLETQIREFQEPAFKILYNLSLNSDIRSLIVSSEFIPKLVPFFEDVTLARYCITILKNLCKVEDARVSVVETDGCIASIAKLLEIDSHEYQEDAVAVLLSLCSQRDQYCRLVMDEGVIPALVDISINGNDKGKVMAMELLRLLRDIKYTELQECPEPDLDLARDSSNYSKEKKSSSKGPGLFRKILIFLKTGTKKEKIEL